MTNQPDDEDTIVIDPAELAFPRTTTCRLPPPYVRTETVGDVRVLGRIALVSSRRRQAIPVVRFEDLDVREAGADE